ncbi:MAG: ATP-binding protein [Enterobacteriaceae bacterium]
MGYTFCYGLILTAGDNDATHIAKFIDFVEEKVNPETDLLILDEIGECERAVTSLKYFAEKALGYFVAASGSNIGLLNAFPVGKVEQYNLRPLTFREFIYASQETEYLA